MLGSTPPLNRPAHDLLSRLRFIRQRMELACEKSGRSPEDIRLVVVTKTIGVQLINGLLAQGLKEIGESRVQEAEQKAPLLKGQFVFHLVGRLQTNKARRAVHLFDCIQSVDRERVAVFLNRAAEEKGSVKDCLVEINISGESSKGGFSFEEASPFVKAFKNRFKNLNLNGVMGIGPISPSKEDTRMAFRRLFQFYQRHIDFFGGRPVLSMGMSDDFEIAIEEGSNMIRIGRAIFGERSGENRVDSATDKIQ